MKQIVCAHPKNSFLFSHGKIAYPISECEIDDNEVKSMTATSTKKLQEAVFAQDEVSESEKLNTRSEHLVEDQANNRAEKKQINNHFS